MPQSAGKDDTMKKILVAEDEQNIREFVVINLERAGYHAAVSTGPVFEQQHAGRH